ncbi:MAG TPA: AbfB domain-containing protein [Pilimelia sp.]|nr:AbfB domain-containing protein [Pilimelia sp.]
MHDLSRVPPVLPGPDDGTARRASARAVRAVVALALCLAAAAVVVRSTGADAAGEPFKGVANSSCADLSRLAATWWYNWYINPGGCNAGEFVPMVSGKDKHGAGDIAWQRDQAINAGYKTILGFNEPDHADQANMSVATAVALWPTLTANPAIRIGGPAPASDAGGRTWFTAFMREVEAKRLRVDFLTLHYYGWNAGSCDANASGLEAQIRWMESFPGNRPIWVTEFGCMHQSNPNMAAVNAFYNGALRVFARHPRVERYAWYPWNPHNELVTNGNLTQLGNTLANAPGSRDGTPPGGSGSAPAPGASRIQSYNFPDRYVRHSNFDVRLDPTAGAAQDARFRLVPGLASGGSGQVSFESVSHPGHYLRHYGFDFVLAADDGSATFRSDATFRQVPGLASASWSSFQSYNYPDRYIRHSNYLLRLDPITDQTGRNDATFRVTG